MLKQLKQISLINSTIKRRIVHLDEQVVTSVRSSPAFAIQLDESTDVASLSQLIAFVRYIDKGTMNTEFLFCKLLKTTCKAEDIYNIISNYFQVHKIDWNSRFLYHRWSSSYNGQEDWSNKASKMCRSTINWEPLLSS